MFWYTGQREESSFGLYYYGARWYDPALGRFVQADTVTPDGVQALDRYAYVNNNPLKYTDPTGHLPKIEKNNRNEKLERYNSGGIPYQSYEQFIAEAIYYFTTLGYSVVGDPFSKSIYTNGADLVFKAKDGVSVLAVELKNVSGSVNLGTLGRTASGNIGGTINQILVGAAKFQKSSDSQLFAESDAIIKAAESGNLKNALFTPSQSVSDGVRSLFNGVYSINVKNDVVNVIKGLGTGTAGLSTGIISGMQSFGNFIGNSLTTFVSPFFPCTIPDGFFKRWE